MLPGIGVFGTGAIVKLLVPVLREKGFRIEALWGRTLKEAQDASKELQISFYTNKIDDVLLRKDVDLIFITCAPVLHSQIAVKALGIGKHVVCDKPAGLSQTEALKMVSAAQYYPSLISIVNHSLRFLPAFTQMRKAICDGYLDEITLIDIKVQMGSLLNETYDWLCDDTMGGGTLTLVGSHVVDLVAFLIGYKAVRVHGIIRTFTKTTVRINGIRNISAPDFCSFQMELENGTLVTSTLNNHVAGGTFTQEVLVCGKNGYLAVRGGDLFGRKNKQDMKNTEEVLYLDIEDLQCPTPVSVVPRPYIKGLCKMIGALKEAFLPVKEQAEWIKEPVKLAASFEDGLYVQAVLDAVKRSSRGREWVTVDVMTEQPDPNPLLSAAVRRTTISLS